MPASLLEHQLTVLTIVPALLVMVPAFVSSAGSLGGILTSRCATLLHLGTHRADALARYVFPVRREVRRLLLIALPVQALQRRRRLNLIAQRLDRRGDGGLVHRPARPSPCSVVSLAAGFVVFIA